MIKIQLTRGDAEQVTFTFHIEEGVVVHAKAEDLNGDAVEYTNAEWLHMEGEAMDRYRKLISLAAGKAGM